MTREGSTARVARSPAKPATHMPLPQSTTSAATTREEVKRDHEEQLNRDPDPPSRRGQPSASRPPSFLLPLSPCPSRERLRRVKKLVEFVEPALRLGGLSLRWQQQQRTELLSFFASFLASSNFLLASSAEAVRKRSAEESTCSPNAPASTGRPSCGRPSPEKRRRLRSLLCVPGSARLPGRPPRWRSLLCPWAGPGGGLLSPWGAVLLHLHLLLRTSTVVEISCQGFADGLLLVPKHRAQPLLTSSPSGSSTLELPARFSHEIATQ